MSQPIDESRLVRIAVEGCGHGTLDAIYASIEESCRVKGWNGVDLVIIGGDFQAVRNRHDLNVTAMPQSYRKMADFHQYYSGTKAAPYLTIFIGGNHEASNHLFELYYGGWVAPNIYYLGAANVLRFGPLRIAGLSGIWKGYDYRKPHFERLPYNQEETKSIFHVRELDVRRLLSVRSQVDIGLSHDWPQGVEWLGDHEWLFKTKVLFKDDAENGKLGSVAARQCLDRLRPPYWFSAHLHTKYAAIVEHGGYQPVRHTTARRFMARNFADNPQMTPSETVISSKTSILEESAKNGISKGDNEDQGRIFATPKQDIQQVSAWQNFHIGDQQRGVAERDQILLEQQVRRDEEEKTGKRSQPQYVFSETFKKVTTDDNLRRAITSVEQEERGPGASPKILDVEGCEVSQLASLKRRRHVSNPDEIDVESSDAEIVEGLPRGQCTPSNIDGTTMNSEISINVVSNPDAIDIDTSDEESNSGKKVGSQHVSPDPILPDSGNATVSSNIINVTGDAKRNQTYGNTLSDPSEDGGVRLSPHAASFAPIATISSVMEHDLGIDSQQSIGEGDIKRSEAVRAQEETPQAIFMPEEISDDVRAQLAELSGDFAPAAKIEASPALPLPEAIRNKTTNFLALGKCEVYQEFLQLIEVEAVSVNSGMHTQRPFKLSYDPEWLAILRVFAPELALGGQQTDVVPQHRGDTYYRDRIIQEEKWIDDHVVQPGHLEVPANFSVTASVYDPDLPVDARDMPREVTNPQTTAFCALIRVDNPFDIAEDERDARMESGPRADNPHYGGGRGGRGGRRGRGGEFNRVAGRARGGRGGRGIWR